MHNPITTIACISAVLACAGFPAEAPAAQEASSAEENGEVVEFQFEETVLENGLRVLTLEDFSCPIVAAQVWYHVGSKNENPDRQGFAHMFEHMMFRGTDTLGPKQHFALIQGVGGTCNAFTSFDYTAYVNLLPSNQLDLALWLEAERMMFLNITPEGYETERQVVSEERRMRLNQPYGSVFERLLPKVFTEHPYRWTPIGKIAHLQAADIEELRHFWDTYYVPANATLIIAGAVSHEDAVEAARTYFGWIPKFPEPPRVQVDEPPQEGQREVTIPESMGRVPVVQYMYRGLPQGHPDFTALQFALDILGRGESSRLYQDLVKERKLCQNASTYNWGLEQDGIFYIEAELAQGEEMDTGPVLSALDEHIKRIKEEGATTTELEKVRNQRLRSVVTDQLKVYNKAQELGRATIEHGSPHWVNQQTKAINAVTEEDVERVVQEYFVKDRRTVAIIKPDPAFEYEPVTGEIGDYEPVNEEFQKEDISRPEDYPRTPPLKDLLDELPEHPDNSKTLDNGLKVVVIPNDEVPFATAKLGLKYGAWTENPDRPGTTSMALNMLTKGTEHYTAAELAEKIEYNALELNGSADMDVASVSATGLREKLPLALELLAEVVLRPAFPEDELAILKEQRENMLSVREQDPSYQADLELHKQIFGEHPYARTAEGALKDVQKIGRGDLEHWWSTYAVPTKAVLYIAGDVDPEVAHSLAEKHLGDWQKPEQPPEAELPPLPEPESIHIYLVDKPGAGQSQIRAGHTSITRGHADYHEARVFTQIFGGSFNSRMMDVIRVQRGLTYGARGYFRPRRFTGEFLCSTFTKPETTGETVQAVLDVIQGMRDNPPSPEELTQAKSYLIGGFAKELETPQDIAAYRWIIEYNDLESDYLQQALNEYRTTQVEDIQRVAKEYIDTDHLTIVVVGDAEKVRSQLEEIAPVTVINEQEESREASSS